jgi:hypothetical protein
MPRFLQYEVLTLQAVKSYSKRPRAGDSRTPLYNASLGKQPAKRRHVDQPDRREQPGPSSSQEGRKIIISCSSRFV